MVEIMAYFLTANFETLLNGLLIWFFILSILMGVTRLIQTKPFLALPWKWTGGIAVFMTVLVAVNAGAESSSSIPNGADSTPFEQPIDIIFSSRTEPKEVYIQGYLRCSGLLSLLTSQALYESRTIITDVRLKIYWLNFFALAYAQPELIEALPEDEIFNATEENFEREGKQYFESYMNWINTSGITIDVLEDSRHLFTRDYNVCLKISEQLLERSRLES